MRVVLDSNVIVAAFAARGLCESVFETCISSHEVFVSLKILEEVRAALSRKIRLSQDMVRDIISYLEKNTQTVEIKGGEVPGLRDPDDAAIYQTALAARADFLVTGDKDLLAIAKHSDVAIVSPRMFWDKLRG